MGESAKLKSYLSKLNINFLTHKHPPVFTCEEAEKYDKNIKGIHSKNLFLKSKSKNPSFYLVIIPSKEKLNIKSIENIINEKLSFANEHELKQQLNLTPGSVSIFGLLNNQNTTLILSEKIFNSQFVSFHPNINTETLELNKNDFHIFLDSIKNKRVII